MDIFRGIRGRSGDRKRFFFYCLYAFGVPIVLTGFVYLLDSTLPLELSEYKPLIGITRCWIQGARIVEAIYLYTPISIILAINIALYSITAYKIYKVQKETSVIRNGDSQRHSKIDADKDRYFNLDRAQTRFSLRQPRFFLYLRLFIVMGVTWSMEAISWVFPNNRIAFYASDFLNCIQGFIIFILFVWKPKVKQLIVKR